MENLTCPGCEKDTPIDFAEDGNIYCVHCKRNILGNDVSIDNPSAPRSSKVPDIPGYHLIRKIGEGGMGKVYVGTDTAGTHYAIKVLNEDLSEDPDYLKRFEREADVMEQLIHPHIVRMFGRGKTSHHFIIMDYLEGMTLRQYIIENQPYGPLDMVRQIIIQVANGLDYAHKHNIIHRDIKPENIFLCGESRTVKIMDFGLAGFVRKDSKQQNLTSTGAVLGTFNYMAPEQRVQSKNVDFRADIYSLGVIFYEMLLGELPLGLIRLPSDLRSDLNNGYDEVILNCLATNPDERYSSVEKMVDDMAKVAGLVGHQASNPFGRKPAVVNPPPRDPSVAQRRNETEILVEGSLCPFCGAQSADSKVCSVCHRVIDSREKTRQIFEEAESAAREGAYESAIRSLRVFLELCDPEERVAATQKLRLYEEALQASLTPAIHHPTPEIGHRREGVAPAASEAVTRSPEIKMAAPAAENPASGNVYKDLFKPLDPSSVSRATQVRKSLRGFFDGVRRLIYSLIYYAILAVVVFYLLVAAKILPDSAYFAVVNRVKGVIGGRP